MPELPEIETLARQMDRKLKGLCIDNTEVHQPKCLNVPSAAFASALRGRTVGRSARRGKWVFTELLPDGWLLLNLGMGGGVLYHRPGRPAPDRHQVALRFGDGSALSIRFWWFGYVHVAARDGLPDHKLTADLGLDPLDKRAFTTERFALLLAGRRGAIKQFLLDQRHIAGIGNVYVQDALFLAGLHPNRTIPSLTDDDKRRLHAGIVEHLAEATAAGGLAFEQDLFGRHGRFNAFRVAYRTGEPCPTCGTPVEKVKTGSTASYICPACQV
jgi:formamidopyrimidine-DNA glycosylase